VPEPVLSVARPVPPVRVDGLERPVGRLAFTGFWMLLGSIGPLVLTNADDALRSRRRP
jgi:hypothetical protein